MSPKSALGGGGHRGFGFPDLILMAPQGRYSYQHVTDETAEVQRGKGLAEGPADNKWCLQCGTPDWLASTWAHPRRTGSWWDGEPGQLQLCRA